MNAHSQTSDYEKGPNASCTIRPVLSVVASHLEMVPTNESHLLALCVRIGFGGEVRFSGETCRPPRKHRGRRTDSERYPLFSREWKMQSSALMITSPSTGTDAHDLMKGAREGRLIRKARQIRNIGQ